MICQGSFEVLSLSQPGHAARWDNLWRQWPEREIWAHPEYLRLVSDGGEPILLHYEENSAEILFPLLLRKVSERLAGEKQAFDLTGPYGYGGPYSSCPDIVECPGFWSAMERWARALGCVSLFCRLDVEEGKVLRDAPAAVTVARNVVRRLDLPLDEMWMDYDHKVRKNVKRARREGVEVVVDSWGEYLDAFVRVYHATMSRRMARQSFFFRREWFENLVERLSGHFVFFHALYKGAVISTELLLLSSTKVYSFLGGTDDKHFDKRPNDLLKHEIIRWAQAAGKKSYVLGGGFVSGNSAGDDGILRYKHGFAPSGLVPFRVMKWILDEERYDALVKAWEMIAGQSADPIDGYFPAYRKPVPEGRAGGAAGGGGV